MERYLLAMGFCNSRARMVQPRPRRRQPGDRHAVGGAGDVVEAGALEEVDRLRIAAVLTADAEVEVRTGSPPPLAGQADELSDPSLVDALEGIVVEDAELHVLRQEP